MVLKTTGLFGRGFPYKCWRADSADIDKIRPEFARSGACPEYILITHRRSGVPPSASRSVPIVTRPVTLPGSRPRPHASRAARTNSWTFPSARAMCVLVASDSDPALELAAHALRLAERWPRGSRPIRRSSPRSRQLVELEGAGVVRLLRDRQPKPKAE